MTPEYTPFDPTGRWAVAVKPHDSPSWRLLGTCGRRESAEAWLFRFFGLADVRILGPNPDRSSPTAEVRHD